jgi:hypothetical protein
MSLKALNVDHHAPVREMFRFVSSGNLAIDYVDRFGVAPPEKAVVVHHTDCDSVISSLIVRGILPPHPALAQAVVAADHAGERNDIADLLQALDPKRDLNFSARNLGLLLTDQPLDPEAQQMLDRQLSGRQIAEDLISRGEIEYFGDIALVHYREDLRIEYLPALLPESAVILMAGEPHQINGTPTPDHTTSRLRRGLAAPDGFTIYDLRIPEAIDPNYGGRWNAGANRRGGGTTLSPSEYALRVQQQYERFKTETTA